MSSFATVCRWISNRPYSFRPTLFYIIWLVSVIGLFALVVAMWLEETGISWEDVNSGAIAHGHSFEATGTKLLTKLAHGLKRMGQDTIAYTKVLFLVERVTQVASYRVRLPESSDFRLARARFSEIRRGVINLFGERFVRG